jgi:hypothetical protein
MKWLLALVMMGIGVGAFADVKDGTRITGTYSDITYNAEGDDLLGTEIRIVLGSGWRYQGTIQIAEGGMSDLDCFNIQEDKGILTFDVSLKNYEGKFVGKVWEGMLIGKLTFKNGGVMNLKLPRKKSYWE